MNLLVEAAAAGAASRFITAVALLFSTDGDGGGGDPTPFSGWPFSSFPLVDGGDLFGAADDWSVSHFFTASDGFSDFFSFSLAPPPPSLASALFLETTSSAASAALLASALFPEADEVDDDLRPLLLAAAAVAAVSEETEMLVPMRDNLLWTSFRLTSDEDGGSADGGGGVGLDVDELWRVRSTVKFGGGGGVGLEVDELWRVRSTVKFGKFWEVFTGLSISSEN